MGWTVPEIHIRAAIWLATFGSLGVLRCFRGFGKSTLLAIYNAWRYYEDQEYRILHQGDQDGTAYKTSRDTKRILARHPWTRHLAELRGEVSFWWVPGAEDERNPSMQAAGIMSNITSSRADEVQNDDVEVPRNIRTPEARETLRYRLGEQTHILVPGGRKLYIGTPHTHDSIYDEMARLGADCLTIRMFEHEHRVESADRRDYKLPFDPEFVFFGIGETARLLKRGEDYRSSGNIVEFKKPPHGLVDFYAGIAWAERFTPAELEKRRRETRTVNEWDSQYQLHSKPVSEVRLDPSKVIIYAVEPEIRIANKTPSLWLGNVQIVGMAARWDPSSAKLNSDVSAFGVVLFDAQGRRYVHRTAALTGEVAEFDRDGRKITGGQVFQICEHVRKLNISRVVVETNGIGGFAPAVLRAALKQAGLRCAVVDETSVINKGRRILEAFEDVLSARMLWAHVDVMNGPLRDQMRDFVPTVKDQADDYVDVVAGAMLDNPDRFDITAGEAKASSDWRPSSGVHEVEFIR